ncbi:MAG: type I DNA topoisomerase [Verrucomicrobia bacterium]|nr:type I DNA topoisomerase [Verrucomicrobiota bacterium]MCH8512364.1 type I DNA topoisomerase [Kiritimatiellia bacterium]
MSKHLVIVESPAKAKTINKFLGKNYIVKASYGHVRDLPNSKLGVDPENNFEPKYVNSRDKSKVIKELKDAAKKCEDVILAPDPDREGEAIAWHLRELLKKEVKEDERFSRVTYNQITRPAIEKAFASPGQLDMHKVDAQQARRVLDRLVGYGVSPLLWRRIRGGSSAGRVQTVALRLVCEREKEILAFTPETYWIFGAMAAKQVDPKDGFEVRLLKIDGGKGEVRDEKLAGEILRDLEGKHLKVDKIQTKEAKRRPQPPFITSTLQQAASSAYGFQPNRTMSLAQKLYEGVTLQGETTGLITYMRTDSVHLAGEAIDEARSCIEKTYGAEYVPEKPNYYRSRGAAQEAHEAIRPTDLNRTPDSLRAVLDDAELKLYSLIWKRTMACQMEAARIEQVTVDIGADSQAHEYLFRANASKILFPGYMAAWGRGLTEDDEDEKDSSLPPLKEGEALDVLEWLREEKQTQPPKRFSEAALIKSLEENGVGRPSTYAAIVSVLYSREYVERESRSLRPTPTGMEVHNFLIERLPTLFEVDFTARMEDQLDNIEEGKLHWTDMMRDFHNRLETWIEEAKNFKIDKNEIKNLLDLADEVQKFNPPATRGKKTYCDDTFVREIREALEADEEVTDRQVDNLRKIVARYAPQIKSLDETKIRELELTDLIAKEAEANQPPRESTLLKFKMLEGIEFEPPRQVGKKTYDDAEFSGSLREQVEGGKRLSENQVKYLDRLVTKYAAKIPDFETKAKEAGLSTEVEEDNESGPLVELLDHVKTFNEPTTRGKKTWDDAEFAESLASQYKARKSLSPRQRSALKRMLGKYHEQIPGYAEKRESLGLPVPGASGKKKKS